MRRQTEPTTDEYNAEVHPAFALIGASRIQQNPATALFDSDIKHQNTLRISIHLASRRRELHHDWIHPGQQLIEVEVSEAQWASFVSTLNSGSGVPCTLRWFNGDDIDTFPHEPRLAETMAETHEAAEKAFAAIKDAFIKLESAAGAKDKREAMSWLRSVINNATPNVDFAGDQLVKQAENVVQKAKADIEAYVVQKAQQLGIEAPEMLALEPGDIV